MSSVRPTTYSLYVQPHPITTYNVVMDNVLDYTFVLEGRIGSGTYLLLVVGVRIK